jgi:hypothetical protein
MLRMHGAMPPLLRMNLGHGASAQGLLGKYIKVDYHEVAFNGRCCEVL